MMILTVVTLLLFVRSKGEKLCSPDFNYKQIEQSVNNIIAKSEAITNLQYTTVENVKKEFSNKFLSLNKLTNSSEYYDEAEKCYKIGGKSYSPESPNGYSIMLSLLNNVKIIFPVQLINTAYYSSAGLQINLEVLSNDYTFATVVFSTNVSTVGVKNNETLSDTFIPCLYEKILDKRGKEFNQLQNLLSNTIMSFQTTVNSFLTIKNQTFHWSNNKINISTTFQSNCTNIAIVLGKPFKISSFSPYVGPSRVKVVLNQMKELISNIKQFMKQLQTYSGFDQSDLSITQKIDSWSEFFREFDVHSHAGTLIVSSTVVQLIMVIFFVYCTYITFKCYRRIVNIRDRTQMRQVLESIPLREVN